MKLTACFDECVNEWLDLYSQEAMSGSSDSMIIYAKLLMRGSKSFQCDIKQALYWLKKACKHNPEASLILGKIYCKGKYVHKDAEKAFFYLKLATLFKCKCGKLREQYHNNLITNVHPCFPDEAGKEIVKLGIGEEMIQKFEEDFKTWRSSL